MVVEIALTIAFGAQLPAIFPRDYLDTGKLWSRAPERPIGPVPNPQAEAYIRAMSEAKMPMYSSGMPPMKVDSDILRLCLTAPNGELLSQLSQAHGVLLGELVVEIHRRKVPQRVPAFLNMIKKNRSHADSWGVSWAAQAITAIGGPVGREGAFALAESANPAVHLTGLTHLARLGDKRALKPLIKRVESDGPKRLDPICHRFLIQQGYADTEAGLRRLVQLHDMGAYRAIITDLVQRNAAPVNRYLVEIAGNRKEYHGKKTWMIEAMRKVDSPRHTPALRKMLGDSWALVRIAAAQELVRRKDKASLPLMRKAVAMKDEQNRINGTDYDRSEYMRECIRQLESNQPEPTRANPNQPELTRTNPNQPELTRTNPYKSQTLH